MPAARLPGARLPAARLIGIGLGGFSLAAIWGTYNVFMPLLLGDFIESRALRGAVMGLDNVVAVLLIPVVGAWSDRVAGRWGKRLPFLLAGMPLAALAFAGLPWAATALWSLLAVDVVFLLAVTLYRAPLVALMPDHVAPADRSAGNGVITLMSALGGAVALLALAPTFDAARAAPFALAALAALVALAVVVVAAERHPPYVEPGAAADDVPVLRGLGRELRALATPAHRGPAWLLAGLFGGFFGFAAVEAQFSTFATETLALTGGEAGRAFGGASVAFLLVALPVGLLARRLGELRVMRAGMGLLLAALVVVAAPWGGGFTYVGMALAGLGWAGVLVPAYPLVADQGGRDRIGTYTGLYYLVGSGAAIVAPAIVGASMDAFGNRALFVGAGAAVALGAWALARAGRHGVESASRLPAA